jgi:hypothetical protein
MKLIYSLDTWVLFLIFLVPAILQNCDNGDVLLLLVFSLGVIWFYILTIDLYKKLSGGHFFNLKKFQFHFIFPLTYFSITLFFGGYSITSNNINEYGLAAPLLIVLHLFSTYCVFYCIYFTSKMLIAVFTNNNHPHTSSYIGYFFGFWFLPIGIWFIQPKIKKIFSD